MSNTSLLGSYGGQAGDGLFFRNRILNGCMRIDQRNSGAAVSTSAVFVYPVDRFRIKNDLANGTTQRSTTAPTGFTNSLVFTTGTGAAASGACTLGQAVEGFNIADLAWGTAAAQAVTMSFWVRSSLTGTFAFRISNGARSYVATYTISSANTFEFKTIVIPGDTSGTWVTDNSVGMYLNWDLGSGSNFTAASAGSWLAGDFLRVSGTVNVVSTSGATLYITGVQLEAGPTATPFERRPYSVELGMCQRYYETTTNPNGIAFTSYAPASSNIFRQVISFATPKRTRLYTITVSTFSSTNLQNLSLTTAITNNNWSNDYSFIIAGESIAAGVISWSAGKLEVNAEL